MWVWDIELWELLSKRRKVIGTKRSWNLLLLGPNVFGTYGYWDKMYLGLLVFGTILFFLGHIGIGTKGIGTKCQWDNLPTGNMSLGQFT